MFLIWLEISSSVDFFLDKKVRWESLKLVSGDCFCIRVEYCIWAFRLLLVLGWAGKVQKKETFGYLSGHLVISLKN